VFCPALCSAYCTSFDSESEASESSSCHHDRHGHIGSDGCSSTEPPSPDVSSSSIASTGSLASTAIEVWSEEDPLGSVAHSQSQLEAASHCDHPRPGSGVAFVKDPTWPSAKRQNCSHSSTPTDDLYSVTASDEWAPADPLDSEAAVGHGAPGSVPAAQDSCPTAQCHAQPEASASPKKEVNGAASSGCPSRAAGELP
jgi:hypothetical protein